VRSAVRASDADRLRLTPAARTVRSRAARASQQYGQQYGLIIAWATIVGVFGILRPTTFLTSANFSTIAGSQAVLVILVLGMIFPLTAGDFDLSVASVLTLSAMTVVLLNVNHHWPIGLAISVGILTGVAIGFVNGGLVVLLRMDPFIATLGTGTVLSGVIEWISGSQTIAGVSGELVRGVTNNLFGIPLAFYYGLVLCVVIWYIFRYTPTGLRLLFVGRSRAVSRLSGVNVDRVRWGALTVSGAFAGGAGVAYAGMLGAADPSSGQAYLLPAFAAAFLGATTISPGRFNPWGSFIAVYFLVTGITGLQLMGAQVYIQNLFYGGALLIAVGLSRLARRGDAREVGAVG
jgi:ribose transport system permease protein